MPRKRKGGNRRKAGRKGRKGAIQRGGAGLASNTNRVESKADVGMVVSLGGVIGGFPDRAKATLRYVMGATLTSTSGVLVRQRFRGNSGFDPDETGTGGQPANWDDWTLIYNRYLCTGSRITVTCQGTGSAAANLQNFVVYPYNVTAESKVDDAMCQPYSTLVVTSSLPSIISRYMSSAKILGRNPRTSDGCQAAYNANPADVWYWDTFAMSSDGSTTTTGYYAYILEYDFEFYDRVPNGIDVKAARMQEILTMRALREKREPRGNPPMGGFGTPVPDSPVLVSSPSPSRKGEGDSKEATKPKPLILAKARTSG